MENGTAQERQALAMQRIGMMMGILMSVSLSFFLSLVGFVSSGHFELKGWLVSFGASTVLSLLIGFLLPVRKAGAAACRLCGLKERTLPFHCLDTLVSDLFYTPLITLLMVALAFMGVKRGLSEAVAHGAPPESLPQIAFLPMFLKSLAVSMVVGYVLIFVLQPLFLRLLRGSGAPHGQEQQTKGVMR